MLGLHSVQMWWKIRTKAKEVKKKSTLTSDVVNKWVQQLWSSLDKQWQLLEEIGKKLVIDVSNPEEWCKVKKCRLLHLVVVSCSWSINIPYWEFCKPLYPEKTWNEVCSHQFLAQEGKWNGIQELAIFQTHHLDGTVVWNLVPPDLRQQRTHDIEQVQWIGSSPLSLLSWISLDSRQGWTKRKN